MHQGLVAHEQGTHELEGGDLQGEVEGGDDCDRAIWPPKPVAGLTSVVA